MISKKKLISELKADLRAADVNKTYLDGNRNKWVSEYEGKPYGNEEKGKSQIVSRDIKKSAEWQRASLLDPFVSSKEMVRCDPVTWEDKPGAEQAEQLLNYQFCRVFPRYNFMSNSIKVLQREGTVVVRTSWETVEEEVEEIVPGEINLVDAQIAQMQGVPYMPPMEVQKVMKKVVNKPNAEVIDNLDLWVDPTCVNSIENAQFVIHRFESNLSMLKQDGRYENLEAVDKWLSDGDDYDSLYPERDASNEFKFSDTPRKKVYVYEYWGNYDINEDGIAEPIVCTWVGETVIRLEENPYPDQKIPFVSCAFSANPFAITGSANADLISPQQKIKTAIQRAVIDNMAQSTNGQKGFRVGTLDLLNKKRFLNGKNFEYKGEKQDFFEGTFNSIPSSVLDFFNMTTYDIEGLTGIKSFSNGGLGGASLGNTATGAQGVLDATARRELDIVRNISENLVKPLLRKWLDYSAEFMDEEEVIRITNDEFVQIKRDDLNSSVDIDISVSTAENDSAKAQEIAFMLQTIGPNEDPGIRKMLLSELFRLRQMPEMAKQIEEYQPQPDPIEARLRELEVAYREAEINDKNARAEENKVDMSLKSAKARNENTKADLNDQTFLDKEDGVDRSYEMMKELNKQTHEKEKIALELAAEKEKNRSATRQQIAIEGAKAAFAPQAPKKTV